MTTVGGRCGEGRRRWGTDELHFFGIKKKVIFSAVFSFSVAGSA